MKTLARLCPKAQKFHLAAPFYSTLINVLHPSAPFDPEVVSLQDVAARSQEMIWHISPLTTQQHVVFTQGLFTNHTHEL